MPYCTTTKSSQTSGFIHMKTELGMRDCHWFKAEEDLQEDRGYGGEIMGVADECISFMEKESRLKSYQFLTGLLQSQQIQLGVHFGMCHKDWLTGVNAYDKNINHSNNNDNTAVDNDVNTINTILAATDNDLLLVFIMRHCQCR